jgi:hypothetical protein
MGLVESEIGTLTTNVGKLDTSMGLVESEIGTLTTNVGKLDTSMGLVEGAIGTLTTNVGKLDTSMGLVEGAIGTLTTNVGKLDTSMGLVVFQENGVLLSDLSANGFKIKSLADPVDNQDAATKKYVDDNIGGGSSISPMVTNWTLVLTHFTVGNGSATGYYQVIGNLCVAQFKIIVGDEWGVTQLTDSLYIDTPLPVYSNTPDDIVVGQINMKIKNSAIPVNGNLIRKSFGNGQKLLITVNKPASDNIGFNYIGNYELNGVTYPDLTVELDYITGTFSYMIQI